MSQSEEWQAVSSQVRVPEVPVLPKPWKVGSINVDRASRALAAAFGCGPCMAVLGQASWVESLPDEEGAFDPEGLAIHTRGRVVQDARRYLPSDAVSRGIALRSLGADASSLAVDFDRTANMRADACATRVRRVRRWDNHRFAGTVVIPAVRPVRPVLLALSEASLDGPLEAWLMVYAAQRMEFWPRVEMYLSAMGHRPEVAREAAVKLLKPRAGRSYRDGARLFRMRERTYRELVSRVQSILWDWLERASYALLEELGEAEGWNIGEGRLLQVSAGA